MPLTVSIRLTQYPSPGHYQDITNRDEPAIVHFEDLTRPRSQQFEVLESGYHPGTKREAFYVDVSQLSVPDVPSTVPATILFGDNRKLETVEDGNMNNFFNLVKRAEQY